TFFPFLKKHINKRAPYSGALKYFIFLISSRIRFRLVAILIRRLKQSTGLDDCLRNLYLPTKKVPRTIEGLRAQSPSTT
ncbi:hypothetical protein, partial [Streptococcus sp. GMD4S]|uniref:hypothetical protein n=1 Tax=Streptococcus sp. GMD4S TaxID=1169673 RepID=UPI001ED9B0CC